MEERDYRMIEIEIENLSKNFGNLQVINNLNLTVREGELLCIVGPSGCGKTTLLRMIIGLDRADGGTVKVDGELVRSPNPRMGIIFQESTLFPWRKVLGNVKFGLEVKGLGKEQQVEIARNYIQFVGLEGFEDYYPHQLSGGMKQRVMLARVLAVNPDVLLMDEPFASVDAQTRSILQSELVKIWQKTGKTIIFVTHSLDESVYLGQRVAILSARPSTMKEMINVDLKYPRDRLSATFLEVRARALKLIEEEVRKTMSQPSLNPQLTVVSSEMMRARFLRD